MAESTSTVTVHRTSITGRRDFNEDTECVKRNLSPENGSAINIGFAPIDLFIVCDGHGGDQVSKFIVVKLAEHFMKKSNVYPLSNLLINQIYDKIQRQLEQHPNRIASECGSTALVVIRYALKNRKFLQVINIGDCRAVLCRDGLALPLTKDHKPDWPEEKRRIKDVNREYDTNEPIHYEDKAWRIGDISVSRSFGDLDNVPFVTHVPEIFNYPLIYGKDEFIIMACDGLWDVISNDVGVNFVRDHMTKNLIFTHNLRNYPPKDDKSGDNIARKLADYAYAKGSDDNISVLLLIFN